MTTPNKVLDQPAYNSNVNTWGTGPLNTNFGYIDLALGGSTLLNATGLGGTTVALSASQCIPLTLSISGTPGGIVTYTVPAATGGQWVLRNGTTGGYAVRVQSASGGTYVTINAGDNVQVSCDGTATGMVRNDTTASAGGSTTQVQYNNAGVLAGSANMTFNGTVLTAHTLDASTGGVIFPDNTTQTTAGVVAPAGSDTQVQFNDGGVFAGDAGLVFNKTTNALTTTGLLTAAGATLSSTLTMTAAAINGAVRVDVASATTCAIGAAASNYVRITGTTTITGMGTVASGIYRDVVFAGALTLTYNATSLILPTAANIVTVAGDTAGFISEGSGNWRCLWYSRASGTALALNSSPITNSLGADVTCNNTALYFDGPSVAQGSTGTWFASGAVSIAAYQGHENYIKLWDGTTVIASARVAYNAANHATSVSLSGYITSPAGNIRISVRDASGTGLIIWNGSGNEKDSTVTALRIA
jgi:hypothetical protein